jgi:hypothetical protein
MPLFRGVNLRDEGFLAFFEPSSSDPHEAIERAISFQCGNISISDTTGNDHYEKAVKLVQREVEWRRSARGNKAPLIPEGSETIWTIIGSNQIQNSKGKLIYHRVLANETSIDVGADVERALSLGATHISLEVKQWKRARSVP